MPTICKICYLDDKRAVVFCVKLVVKVKCFVSVPSVYGCLFVVTIVCFKRELFIEGDDGGKYLAATIMTTYTATIVGLSMAFLKEPGASRVILSMTRDLIIFSVTFILYETYRCLETLRRGRGPIVTKLLPSERRTFTATISKLSNVVSATGIVTMGYATSGVPSRDRGVRLRIAKELYTYYRNYDIY